jgi:hypothetical protein
VELETVVVVVVVGVDELVVSLDVVVDGASALVVPSVEPVSDDVEKNW